MLEIEQNKEFILRLLVEQLKTLLVHDSHIEERNDSFERYRDYTIKYQEIFRWLVKEWEDAICSEMLKKDVTAILGLCLRHEFEIDHIEETDWPKNDAFVPKMPTHRVSKYYKCKHCPREEVSYFYDGNYSHSDVLVRGY